MNLYKYTKTEANKIGEKYMANVDISLLSIDPRFQRVDTYTPSKVRRLAVEFDSDKMDILRLSPHDEEEKFSVIDGYHRYMAAKTKGIETLPCEIIMGMPKDPGQRLKREAEIFVSQDKNTERLTPLQKHGANIILGERANVNLQKAIDKHKIKVKNLKTRSTKQVGVLTGFADALVIAGYGERYIDETFRILKEAKWDLMPCGLGARQISAIGKMVKMHECDPRVSSLIIEYLRPIDYQMYISRGMSTYPTRKPQEGLIMILEDYVVEHNVQRVYFGGKVA